MGILDKVLWNESDSLSFKYKLFFSTWLTSYKTSPPHPKPPQIYVVHSREAPSRRREVPHLAIELKAKTFKFSTLPTGKITILSKLFLKPKMALNYISNQLN